jgi:signal recognition particle receptor subunit beta
LVFFNYTTMQMTAKIVYYGPGLCGKTTNLQHIHRKTAPQSRGEMVSLETQTDRTLFFDLLPLEVGVIGGLRVNLQLYTVPGQVFYNATRKLVLKGVDGIVFVADSQEAMLDANAESLRNLEENLAELGLDLAQVPTVFQFNKRDLRAIVPVETLTRHLNPHGLPHFEAAALHGVGVFETLKAITRLTIQQIRKTALADQGKPATAPPPPATAPPPPAAAAPVPPPVAAATPPPLPHTSKPRRPAPTKLEFAEEDTDKVKVRPVKMRGTGDIHRELESLRSAPSRAVTPGVSPEAERRVQEIRESQRSIRRSARVRVPPDALAGATTLSVHISLDSGGKERLLRDAVTVSLGGAGKLQHLSLHLDLDLDGQE